MGADGTATIGLWKALEIGTYTGYSALTDTLRFGSVLDSNLLDADLRSRISNADIDAMRKLNEKVKIDPRVDATMLSLADGLTLVRKL